MFDDCWLLNDLKLFALLNVFRLLLFPLLKLGDDVGNVRDDETLFVNPGSTLPRPKLLIFDEVPPMFVPVITFPWGVPYWSWFRVCA